MRLRNSVCQEALVLNIVDVVIFPHKCCYVSSLSLYCIRMSSCLGWQQLQYIHCNHSCIKLASKSDQSIMRDLYITLMLSVSY